mmetsp:Transcript_8842/g.12985  ORF Transcript_8842/g.12985 Transcript_8842/m.12985 type:complete len:80 (-) Transcript_8842:258-497(-)
MHLARLTSGESTQNPVFSLIPYGGSVIIASNPSLSSPSIATAALASLLTPSDIESPLMIEDGTVKFLDMKSRRISSRLT